MGANAQTSVPLFVANAILTAAQQNISAATGVPVFATTVTRDAAFGGSNKVLAEGQLAYIEATDIVQYYTGSAWATLAPTASKVAQVVSTAKTDTFTSASTSFTDVTGLSVSITPTLNTSKVLVLAQVSGSEAFGTSAGFARLVRASTAIDIGDTAGSRISASLNLSPSNGTAAVTYPIIFLDSPATTSATTYLIQVKTNAGTIYINRSQSDTDNTSNPRLASTITVMEILA